MRIFGLEITSNKNYSPPIEEQRYLYKAKASILFGDAKGAKNRSPVFSKMSTYQKPVMDYEYSASRTDFIEPEWDLATVGRVASGESYFARSVRIKTALMMKQDWQLVGVNPKTVEYIKKRFRQISLATGEPIHLLLWRTGSDLIQYSNAFWVKVRDRNLKGARPNRRTDRAKVLDPVAAYFYMSPETVLFNKRKYAGVKRYKQVLPDSDETRIFEADDVVHFSYDKRGGMTIGMPQVVPALADIQLLRKLESNVALLVYKHLFPLFHYLVGTEKQPADIDKATGKDEVTVVRDAINIMPASGALVTDHRQEIRVVGAENRALRVESYLEFFKRRVFSGLAISGIDVGETDTANRATAGAVSQAMVDNVKDYQRLLEWQIDQYVIQELLLESTLADSLDMLDEENQVHFKFPEIDIDSQIKTETHALNLWVQGALTHDELRGYLHRDPLSDTDYENTFYEKVKKELLRYEAEMKAKYAVPTTGFGGSSTSSAGSLTSKAQPTNQHGTKTGPKKTADSFLPNLDRLYNPSTKEVDLSTVISSLYLMGIDRAGEEDIILDECSRYARLAQRKIKELADIGVISKDTVKAVMEGTFNAMIDKETKCL